MGLDISSAIQNRKSVRNFLSGGIVSENEVRSICRSGMSAPSAKNRQPWKFYIVSGEKKSMIAERLIGHAKSLKEKRFDDWKSVDGSGHAIDECSYLVLIYNPISDPPWNTEDAISVGCCVENMCLEAVNYGFGTLILRDIEYAEFFINKLLGIEQGEEYVHLMCGLCIGLYNPTDNQNQVSKKAERDCIEFVK